MGNTAVAQLQYCCRLDLAKALEKPHFRRQFTPPLSQTRGTRKVFKALPLTWFSVSCLHSISCSTHPSSSFIELLSSELILDRNQLQSPLNNSTMASPPLSERFTIMKKKLPRTISLIQISPLAVVWWRQAGRGGSAAAATSLLLPPTAHARTSPSKNVQPAHVHTRLLSPCSAHEQRDPALRSGASFSFCCRPSF